MKKQTTTIGRSCRRINFTGASLSLVAVTKFKNDVECVARIAALNQQEEKFNFLVRILSMFRTNKVTALIQNLSANLFHASKETERMNSCISVTGDDFPGTHETPLALQICFFRKRERTAFYIISAETDSTGQICNLRV